MYKVWAIVLVTFREAVRRKVFYALVLFALSLFASSMTFGTSDPADRIRLAQVWSLRLSGFFSVLLAILLAAYSLPNDLKSRVVMSVLSKPINRTMLFFGKFIGISSIVSLFVLGSALISLAYVRTIALRNELPLQAHAWIVPTEFSYSLSSKGKVTPGKGLRVYVTGEEGSMPAWEFVGIDTRTLPDDWVHGKLVLGVGSTENEFIATTAAWVKVIDLSEGGQEHVLPDPVQLRHKALVPFSFPRTWISESPFRIQIRLVDKTAFMIVREDTMKLESRGYSYEWNFLKGNVLLILQNVLIVALTMCASTVLSGPVSIFLSTSMWGIGSMMGFLRESFETTRKALAMVVSHAGDGHGHGAGVGDFNAWPLSLALKTAESLLPLFPDLRRFDLKEFMIRDRVVEMSTIGAAAEYTFLYVAILVIIANVLLGTREYT